MKGEEKAMRAHFQIHMVAAVGVPTWRDKQHGTQKRIY
jgi:hypothetical protein